MVTIDDCWKIVALYRTKCFPGRAQYLLISSRLNCQHVVLRVSDLTLHVSLNGQIIQVNSTISKRLKVFT